MESDVSFQVGAAGEHDPADSAGVRLPPPIYFVIGWGIGWALNRWIGGPILPSDAPASTRLVPGLGVAAVGLVCVASAVWTITRAGASVRPDRGTPVLVEAGPYRWTRNPIYLGFALIYAGGAIACNLLWPLVLLPLVVRTVRRRAIEREEAYLERAFGRAYRRYRDRVRRWI
jgi:protein-S-isoprenylcysteine O-methyltransferase Ste14